MVQLLQSHLLLQLDQFDQVFPDHLQKCCLVDPLDLLDLLRQAAPLDLVDPVHQYSQQDLKHLQVQRFPSIPPYLLIQHCQYHLQDL